MPLRKEDYADMEKWTSKQDEKVLKHDIPDSELSAIIHHSVKAIQIRRSRLKKALKNEQ